jgi:hypothetical protein
LTEPGEDATAFERFLAMSRPDVAVMALAVRRAVLERLPGAVEWFDPGNGLLALGTRRSMRDLLFAIVPHAAHVNLQLFDGVDLSNPFGRIEGTGKRARHVKVRSTADAEAPWLAAAIEAQIAYRLPGVDVPATHPPGGTR